ncbi:MAG: DUF4276 family protein [Methanosarcinales archaeon]|jgi:hypothetical protein|nr:DUF4276 family protein [Methanosarcinales archaeon]
MKLVFLLEEPSCKECLDILLPLILPPHIKFQCIPHQGKSDLKKSIPIKLRGWKEPNVKFVIVHDKDNHDCIQLKDDLKKICLTVLKDDVLIRIVCTELESWYLGDLKAVSEAYNSKEILSSSNVYKFQDPDSIKDAKEKLKEITDDQYQVMDGSRRIAKFMDIRQNKSKSFQVFIRGVHDLCKNP